MKITIVALMVALFAQVALAQNITMGIGATNSGPSFMLGVELGSVLWPEVGMQYTKGQLIATSGIGVELYKNLSLHMAAGGGIHERPGWTPVVAVPIQIRYFFIPGWYVAAGIMPVFHTKNSAHEFGQSVCLGYRHPF